MSAPNENEVAAALAIADRNESYAQRQTLGGIRQWVIPNVVSENYDMIASRILAAEVRRLRAYIEQLDREADANQIT